MENQEKGTMTVQEAGRKGGKIGGQTTFNRYGRDFYREIGHEGGQRVKELIREGEEAEKRS